MRTTGWLVQLIMAFVVSLSCFGQVPPPNDNFSNRTILSGTDVVFGGTLAEATVEDPREIEAYYSFIYTQAPQSVWWSWTAPTNTVLNLHILSSSLGDLETYGPTFLFLYTATNGSSSTSNLDLPPLGFQFIAFRLSPQTLSVPVSAGTEYLIQLIGSASASYTFGLIATNTPVIAQQPRSRTVSSNQNVLLYILSAGVSQANFSFQWRFNGTNLGGATNPMLSLTNIDDSAAGAYTVVVSNAYGYTVSDPAFVTVSHSNASITLTALDTSSNSFRFSLTGENGRAYRIESSTDLVHWSPDMGFLKNPYVSNSSTSVVFNSNSPLALTVGNGSARKYFRASPYLPSPASVDLCIHHLQMIRVAKMMWQRDYNSPITAWPYLSELLPYLPGHTAPACPWDSLQSFESSYSIYGLGSDPACKMYPITHFLEEPQ